MDAVSTSFSIAIIFNWFSIVLDDFRSSFVSGDIDEGNEVLNGF